MTADTGSDVVDPNLKIYAIASIINELQAANQKTFLFLTV